MKKRIVIIEGDGIGPEVIRQGKKILLCINNKFNHNFLYTEAIAGKLAIRKYNNPMPDDTIENCLKADAVLFGAIGDDKYDNYPIGMRPEDGLLRLRKKMRLFCNIRPIIGYENIHYSSNTINKPILPNVDFVIYRELSSGIYFGKKGRLKNGEIAYDYCMYSKDEIKEIGIMAFQAADARKKKLTLVDKANVLETSRLWREVIQKLALDYPHVQLECLYVDNASMKIIMNPIDFDVILSDNMFGDILSDEASILSGSLGMIPSASIGKNKKALFEPIHGSYPQAAGKNIANPLGCILSVSMMFHYFGLYKEQKLIENAVKNSINNNIITKDIVHPLEKYYSTEEVGNYIELYIKNH
ncbi:3-isopropylmalate dehydrogenase [Blattabacterium cuenoti]|uniref:3-isopropylmalate dehydrogenase n=1 Tax=Blattabacterium cuenoti TaxID=1653831 RepID=UPI00163C507A|nr:3-isopropylmalate dehydrogenase [Blattabacterium cuenoti]